jgi:hypothetical protein
MEEAECASQSFGHRRIIIIPHQRAAHPTNPGVVGKTARKPPPPPECFFVHFDSASDVTAGDDDAHAKPNRASFIGVSGSHLSSPSRFNLACRRVCTSVISGHSSKDGKAAVAQYTPTATDPCDAHARQLPPPPANRTRQRPLVGKLLHHLRRYARYIAVILTHANNAAVWQPRSRTTWSAKRKERRKRSALSRRQVNLVHLRADKALIVSADEEHLALLALALVDCDSGGVGAGTTRQRQKSP